MLYDHYECNQKSVKDILVFNENPLQSLIQSENSKRAKFCVNTLTHILMIQHITKRYYNDE